MLTERASKTSTYCASVDLWFHLYIQGPFEGQYFLGCAYHDYHEAFLMAMWGSIPIDLFFLQCFPVRTSLEVSCILAWFPCFFSRWDSFPQPGKLPLNHWHQHHWKLASSRFWCKRRFAERGRFNAMQVSVDFHLASKVDGLWKQISYTYSILQPYIVIRIHNRS